VKIAGIKIGFGKDGGEESTVWGWFVEAKRLATVALLRFEDGSREAYHSHAFDCVSVLLEGELHEHHLFGGVFVYRAPCVFVTRKNTFHKVVSVGRSYVATVRGPWADEWLEWTEAQGFQVLTNGREAVRALRGAAA